LNEIDKLKLTENSSLSQDFDPAQAIAGLTLLMALAYLSQGMAQHFCLLSQPLNNYLKTEMSFDAAKVASIQALLMVPWVAKPALGLLSDCLPGPGNGRLNYLLAASLLAAAGYGGACFCISVTPVFSALLLMATSGMSLTTVVVIALTAQDKAQSRAYLGLQSVCYYLANIVALYLGGLLVAHSSPTIALSQALVLSAVMPGLFAFYLYVRYYRTKAAISPASIKAPALTEFFSTLKTLLAKKTFVGTMLFILFWNFCPSMGVSLYFFETDKLHFSQQFIGTLGAISSFGFLLGSLIFRLTMTGTRGSGNIYLMIAVACLVNASYLLLRNETWAVIIELMRGVSGAMFTLNIYSLAARVTPARFAAAMMAFFLCLYNLAGEVGIVCGGYIYSHWSMWGLLPLVMVSIVTTLLSVFFVPWIFSDESVQKIN
jgi:hypothetical protein